MVDVDLGQVSDDAWIQVIVLLVTTCIAISGALLGARVGANATRGATKDAIAAGRAVEEQRRRDAEQDAIRALAAECRLNARLLREVPRPQEAASPSPFLERTASDLALSVFYVLPRELRDRTERTTADVIYLNALLAQREQLSRRQILNRGFDQQIEAFAKSLPESLDDLASQLERFTASDEKSSSPAPIEHCDCP
jgi:hypothetical protein